ncbi:LysM domain receptor-like kinase 4 [Vitis vinifera]|uniref:LysM domain receptor-like kinase 4 n=1 Tax=Vitis vinifera TaxID=29760 RepID=A0A438GM42_VITVI|nr:LysM domain receptor-like kinase 4 [Vitis vinifera]
MKIVDTVAIAHALALAAYADAASASQSSSQQTFSSSTTGGRAAFQWGGTISATFLLILNQVGRRSSIQSSLLVLFLLTSFPAVLFNIVRGQIGRWFAFLAVAANLFFPRKFPVAGFILLVATPDWLANGLRDSIVGGVFCLLLGVCLVITEIRGIGGCSRCECNLLCFGFSVCISSSSSLQYCIYVWDLGRDGVSLGLPSSIKMAWLSFISVFTLSLISFSSSILAQQSYVGKGTTDCDNNNLTSVLGYACNGVNISCQAFLIFRSEPPYNDVSSISDLLGSDPSQLAQINSVDETATFETKKEVIVPVNCSCSGEFSQANTSYVVQHGDTYLLIANNTFEGLSTCQALRSQRTSLTTNIYTGTKLTVPLRCACPTKNQSDVGVKYLMSYLVASGDYVSSISVRFGVDTGMTLEANELSEQNPNIYPFTTLLIPLQNLPSSSQTIVPPPPPPPSPPPPTAVSSPSKSLKKTWVYVVVGVVAGSALVLLFGSVIFFKFFRKTKKKTDPIAISESFEACEKPLKEEQHEFLKSISSIAQSLKVYKFEELQSATDNFSPNCRIKGSVYRGTIKGDLAAIKKMDGEVSNEIALLNKINHFNVIRLSGICFNDGHWYLVHEYAVNGPLTDWIYNNNDDSRFLVWMQRIQIALDVATGLNYLHSYTSPPYVHKDIKSGNVLLDSDFRAKIANFGLARSAEGQEGQFALTRHIIGTRGYMAPEYLENGLVSTKLDVYAFGVLMLEMLTGKEVAALYEGENMHLPDVLVAVLHEGDGKEKLRNFIDPSLSGNYPLELAIVMIRLIDSCLKKAPASRPDMVEIVQALSRTLTISVAWELSNNVSGYQNSS